MWVPWNWISVAIEITLAAFTKPAGLSPRTRATLYNHVVPVNSVPQAAQAAALCRVSLDSGQAGVHAPTCTMYLCEVGQFISAPGYWSRNPSHGRPRVDRCVRALPACLSFIRCARPLTQETNYQRAYEYRENKLHWPHLPWDPMLPVDSHT